jgi:uncharacterized protein (TIGR02145 family)
MKTQVLFLILLFTGFASINAQTTMNIYQSNGTVLQIPISSIDSITYTVNNPGNLATITTLPIGNTTSSSASSGGSISATGGSSVTQRGVCWSTSQNPTTANSSTNNGNGTGSFTSNLTGLTANTTYYVRAYAINSAGTAYGNQLSFTTTYGGCGSITSVTDIDGNVYPVVEIGNQCWTKENLKTSKFADGSGIPNITDDATWTNLSSPAWCNYENNAANDATYGKLYNWYTVADSRNICPAGWHSPTDAEWTVLTDYLGGEAVAGGKMKTTSGWQAPNTSATNESGFSGLPGGIRFPSNGTFPPYGGDIGYWWSSSEGDANIAWNRFLSNSNGNAYRGFNFKHTGFSVRCLRD